MATLARASFAPGLRPRRPNLRRARASARDVSPRANNEGKCGDASWSDADPSRSAPKRVTIVGGGMAGLGCLRALSGLEDVQCTLLESTRVLGGRVRSKTALGALAFDHGASYFTCKSDDAPFAEVLRAAESAGAVQLWTDPDGAHGSVGTARTVLDVSSGHHVLDPESFEPFPEFKRLYVGVPSMASLPSFVADRLARAESPEASWVGDNATPGVPEYLCSAYVDRIAYGGGTVQELFSSRQTLVEDRLALAYGVEGVEGYDNENMVLVTLDPNERAGLLTLTGWLALQSDGVTEDLIHRGAFVNHAVLCVDVPSPGEAVPPLPVEDTEDLTLRELVAEHTGTCGSACHNDYVNPVGFAFTQYDAFGHFQTIDNGHPIDASGQYLFDEGEVSWGDGVAFLEYLSVSPMVHRCYAEHLLTYAEGRAMTSADEDRVDRYMQDSLDGQPIIEMLYTMVTEPAFRRRP